MSFVSSGLTVGKHADSDFFTMVLMRTRGHNGFNTSVSVAFINQNGQRVSSAVMFVQSMVII